MNYPGYQNPNLYPQAYLQNATPSPGINPGGNPIGMNGPITPTFPPSGSFPQNGFNWVQGIEGAKAYPVAPNAVVELWDSESQTIYIKSADRTGMPSIKTLDYKVRTSSENGAPSVLSEPHEETITREEYEALKDKINALEDKLENSQCKCNHEHQKEGRKNNLVNSGSNKRGGSRS